MLSWSSTEAGTPADLGAVVEGHGDEIGDLGEAAAPSVNGDASVVDVHFLNPLDSTNSPHYPYSISVKDGFVISNMSNYLDDGDWILVATRSDAAGNVATAQELMQQAKQQGDKQIVRLDATFKSFRQ